MGSAKEGEATLLRQLHGAPAESVYKATEGGCGLLSIDRPWVRHEGWLLKEAGLASSWHPRYFAVSGDMLEYFKEEAIRVSAPRPDEGLGIELDHSLVVTTIVRGGASQKALAVGDILIGLNGTPLSTRASFMPALAAVLSNPAGPGLATLTLNILRPRTKIPLQVPSPRTRRPTAAARPHAIPMRGARNAGFKPSPVLPSQGASVAIGGPRKLGGCTFVLEPGTSTAPPESGGVRRRYNLVCDSERAAHGWVASIKEAIAAAAMGRINHAISQALQLQTRA